MWALGLNYYQAPALDESIWQIVEHEWPPVAACTALNYGRHSAVALPSLAPEMAPLSPAASFLLEAGYWCLPKPSDYVVILEQALNAKAHMTTLSALPEFAKVQELGAFEPGGIVFSSLVFAVVLLMAAGRKLEKTDY